MYSTLHTCRQTDGRRTTTDRHVNGWTSHCRSGLGTRSRKEEPNQARQGLRQSAKVLKAGS